MDDAFTFCRATVADGPDIAAMTGELLAEIMCRTGVQAFHFDRAETLQRLTDFLHQERYAVFLARPRQGQGEEQGEAAGFVALYESYALYAEGAFGAIPEFYVRPAWRSRRLGRRLLREAKALGVSRGWRRLEVTTPPLPLFERSLAFYEREGFSVTGGRKLKFAL